MPSKRSSLLTPKEIKPSISITVPELSNSNKPTSIKKAKESEKEKDKDKETLEICLDFGQVMITGPLGKVDAKDVGKVRAHAMRQHHHKRRTTTTTTTKPKDVTEAEIIQRKRQVELGMLVHVHSRFQPSPMGAGQNDPFIRLPVANPPKRYYELIDHCEFTIPYAFLFWLVWWFVVDVWGMCKVQEVSVE